MPKVLFASCFSDTSRSLESALRSYSALTKGDIIEITYNSLTFEFLIVDTKPEGPGISIIDTDLEVDFDTPVGYVEPPRPAPAPIPTMADKLKIDLGGTTLASADTSRPESSASMHTQGSGEQAIESFTGVGQSLSGRRVKGKGLAKKIEEVDPSSKINRFTGPRVITNEALNQDRQVPAALILPSGKLFFGYKYVPFDAAADAKQKKAKEPVELSTPVTFQGQGNSLRRTGQSSTSSPAPAAATPAAAPAEDEKPDPWANLGGGQTLSGRRRAAEPAAQGPAAATAPAAPMSQQEIIDATMLTEDDFFDYDDEDGFEVYDSDDDIIEVDD